jgi:uncharacterized protein
MHYLLFYDVIDHYVEKRAPFRSAHLEHARKALERGELVLGGAFANPVDGAVLLFKSESTDVVNRFAETDPYVLNGLITHWRVREWTTVIGDEAVVIL